MVDEDLLPLPGYTEAAATNWLHRKLPAYGIELVGMRAPAYKLQRDLKGYWAQVQAILRSAADRPLVVIGDVNCDPFSDTSPGSRTLLELEKHGYKLPNPDGECSYFGPTGARTRIDHVIASESVQIASTQYRIKAGPLALAGVEAGAALSDHAVLAVSASVRRGSE
jgi:endonuclease/exonuclease/phosphatase family metal-dependent hydrolase